MTGFGRVAVLAGGPSNEREISLRSGKAVHAALAGAGIDAVLLDITGDVERAVGDSGADVAFIALHGRFGEDGAVQAILERMGIPYTGSGPAASRLAIDKVASKEAFIKSGIRVPRHVVFEKGRFPEDEAAGLGLPVVVKPHLEGSSIGLSVVRQADDLASAARKALGFSAKALVEEYIDGRELTVGIVDDEPLPVIEIVAKGGLYDYSAKYTDPGTRYLVPAPISGEAAARARELGRRAHKSLGCRCFSRIDMMMDLSGEIFVLEANTIPGMTERSLLPKAALASGLRFGDLCVKLIDDALKGRPGNGKAEQAEEGKAPGFRRGR